MGLPFFNFNDFYKKNHLPDKKCSTKNLPFDGIDDNIFPHGTDHQYSLEERCITRTAVYRIFFSIQITNIFLHFYVHCNLNKK